MRVLKKPKNQTFNEYFTQRIAVDDSSPTFYMFDYVFTDDKLQTKITTLFEVNGYSLEEGLKIPFEVDFRNKYGEREVDSTIINGIFAKYYNNIENERYNYMSMMFYRYQYKWSNLVDNVYSQTYNPIENYDRQEDNSLSYEVSENVTRNVDSDRKTKGTTTDTRNDTSSANSSSQKNVFAFDSAEASPSDSDSGTTTATGTGSSNSTVDNSDVEKRTETEGHSFNNRKNVTASRIHGNVGVTTSQQMLESEVALRMKHDFFNTVYEDIANTLLKPIY